MTIHHHLTRRLAIVVVLIATVGTLTTAPAAAAPEMSVHVIDVGQGDATLFRLPGDHHVLVDAGPVRAGPTVVAYMDEQGVSQLDLVVATHSHADHIGGLPHVLASRPVSAVWLEDTACSTQTCRRFYHAMAERAITPQLARRGDALSWGDAHALVLNPVEPLSGADNDSSVVVRVTYQNVSFLLTGDAEAAAEREMLAAKLPLQAQILKVGHHGSNTSSTAEFVTRVLPHHAVISVGPNSFDHPHAEALQRLADAGAETWRTDEDGTIVVSTDGRAVRLLATSGRQDIARASELYLPLVVNAHGAGVSPTPVRTSTPTATPTTPKPPAPTSTPTPSVTPTVPGPGIQVDAWVSSPRPARYSTVTVYGRITDDGASAAGIPMTAEWHYKTTTATCSGVSGSDGGASCSRSIGGATAGYPVRVVVTFSYKGRPYSAETVFTPQ